VCIYVKINNNETEIKTYFLLPLCASLANQKEINFSIKLFFLIFVIFSKQNTMATAYWLDFDNVVDVFLQNPNNQFGPLALNQKTTTTYYESLGDFGHSINLLSGIKCELVLECPHCRELIRLDNIAIRIQQDQIRVSMQEQEKLEAEKAYKLICKRENEIENPYEQYCKKNSILRK
jgi:hypothetical protein